MRRSVDWAAVVSWTWCGSSLALVCCEARFSTQCSYHCHCALLGSWLAKQRHHATCTCKFGGWILRHLTNFAAALVSLIVATLTLTARTACLLLPPFFYFLVSCCLVFVILFLFATLFIDLWICCKPFPSENK